MDSLKSPDEHKQPSDAEERWQDYNPTDSLSLSLPDNQSPTPPVTGKENRICKVCKKGFSSGRALGGHMRIHAAQSQGELQLLQEGGHEYDDDTINTNTDNILPIPNSSPIKLKLITKHHRHGNYNKRSAGIGNTAVAGSEAALKYLRVNVHRPWKLKSKSSNIIINRSSNPTCTICGKNFPSMKSLFGHMRCHPERERRGIQPPSSPPQFPSPTEDARISSASLSVSTLSDKEDSSCDHNHNGKIETNDDHQLDFDHCSTTALSALNLVDSFSSSSSSSSWSLTGKRGRKATKALALPIAATVPPPPLASPSDVDIEAAYNLIMLAHHGNPLGLGLGLDFSSRFHSKSNSKQQHAFSPSFRPKIRIGNPQNMEDSSKKRRSDEEDESHSQSAVSAASRKRECLSLPKKLKINVTAAGSLVTSPPNCRNDEEDLGENNRIVHDDLMRMQNISSSQKDVDEDVDDESYSKTHDSDQQPDQLPWMSEMILSQKLKQKMMRKKKKKMKQVRDLKKCVDQLTLTDDDHKQQQQQHKGSATASFSDKFKCRTCNKTFTTHQALGGHRSSHKIGRNPLNRPILITTPTAMDDSGIAGNDEDLTSTSTSTGEEESQSQYQHRCKICYKAFPTGQALGGHQRLHWKSPAEAAAPSSSVASPLPEDISKETGCGTLDFDLNVLPVQTVEDDNEALSAQVIVSPNL
ncbi:uncharacterized protein LOC122073764 [Macadamia integrifolia]|uniref:uncharacterized protein LOC122073764 n=1 Tax=Macadamia integrifolia TaxID=60698 RepID=UPI001C4F662F|nr:uncharacterized protein LOC122073764 [Macadamia integrifolia]